MSGNELIELWRSYCRQCRWQSRPWSKNDAEKWGREHEDRCMSNGKTVLEPDFVPISDVRASDTSKSD